MSKITQIPPAVPEEGGPEVSPPVETSTTPQQVVEMLPMPAIEQIVGQTQGQDPPIEADELDNMPTELNVRELLPYREHFDAEAGECTSLRTFDVEWSQRYLFITTMLGTSYRWQEGQPNQPAVGTLRRVVPDAHAFFPFMYAQSAEMIGGQGVLFNDGDMLAYRMRDSQGDLSDEDGFARYSIIYRGLDYDVLEDSDIDEIAESLTNITAGYPEINRFVTRLKTFGGDALPLPSMAFEFQSPPKRPIPENSVRIFPKQVLKYIWHHLPAIPEAAINASVGCVNDDSFDIVGGADADFTPRYLAEQLLCLPPEVVPYISPAGVREYTVTYNFSYRPDGWNSLYRLDLDGGPGFDPVLSKVGAKPPYPLVDFGQLFIL